MLSRNLQKYVFSVRDEKNGPIRIDRKLMLHRSFWQYVLSLREERNRLTIVYGGWLLFSDVESLASIACILFHLNM
jgi:hypothetical protein